MRFGYFPGCLAGSSAREYDISLKAVFEHLGMELEEIPGWICCGAFEAGSMNPTLATAMPARNLSLFSKRNPTMVISCSACFSNHAKASFLIREDPLLREKIERIIEDKVGALEVRHPLELLEKAPPDTIRIAVRRPLKGLRIIPYYGCNLLRPSKILSVDDPENPTLMERLIRLLGGEALPFSLKSRCCGGALLMADKPLSLKMTTRLWDEISMARPDAVMVLCPQCHMTLETLSDEIQHIRRDIPVIYFTQLAGLAFGMRPEALGLERNLISTDKLVEQLSQRGSASDRRAGGVI